MDRCRGSPGNGVAGSARGIMVNRESSRKEVPWADDDQEFEA